MPTQRTKPDVNEPRILLWDIESTNLKASFGTILCIGYKWFGNPKVTVISTLDKGGKAFDDLPVVRRFADVFNSADYHVQWYGDRFDLPMVRTKMLENGLPPLRPIPSLDLWRTARYKFLLHSNRLAAWEEYLQTEHGKTPIKMSAWRAAPLGDKKAMAEVKDHCAKDVETLEDVFKRFRPWMDNEPNRSLFTGEVHACPSCGGVLKRQGFKISVTRRYQQWSCTSCGRWTRTVAADKQRRMEHRASST